MTISRGILNALGLALLAAAAACDHTNPASVPTSPSPAPATPGPSTFPVTLSGTVTKISGACPDLVLTIGVLDVRTTAATSFNDKGCADIKVGDTASIAGSRTDAVVTATRVEASTTPPAPPTVSVVGTVEELSGSCPALTMKIASTTIATGASTAFGGTGGCAAIKVGSGGLVAGIRQADGTLRATFVSLAPPK